MDPSLEALNTTLAGRDDLRLVLAFGSRARGDATDTSDLDLAVSAPSVDLLALAAELSERLGVEVDVVDLDGDVPIPLLMRLIDESVVVHEGVRHTAAAWRTRTLLALEIDGPWYRRQRDAFLARVAERGL
ncbi:MAG: nucleotidyltransferase domain-containing protein [Sandaracinaceae bacterium]